jgi:hypothetical protein
MLNLLLEIYASDGLNLSTHLLGVSSMLLIMVTVVISMELTSI